MQKPVLKVNVISDIVCPWCYIGKRRLEKAIHNLSAKFDFEVEYFPFELNPKMPLSGLDQKQYLTDKFGSEEHYEQRIAQTTDVAKNEGLTFNFEVQGVSPNTRNMHRLIQLAKESNSHMALVEAFFKAYFTDGVDLSKTENLIHIAEQTGIERTTATLFLQSNTGVAEVEVAAHKFRQLGISGVPFYIINNKYGISGAQSTESFIQAFENISSETSLVGDTCETDGKNC